MPDTAAPRPDAELATLLGAASLKADAVPEFLWYDLAIEALGPDAPASARLAALRVLSRTPRAWDSVMMVALTTADLGVQLATLEALRAHAEAEPERLEAFGRLGDLPAWHPEARKTWEAAWHDLAEAYEAGRRERMWRELNERVSRLAVENADLLELGRSMQAELARAQRAEIEAIERVDSLEACLSAETERLEALLSTEADRVAEIAQAERDAHGSAVAEEAAKAQALAAAKVAALTLDLENERIARGSERGVLVQARIEAETGMKRWRVAAGVGLFVAVGPLLALAAGSAPVMATGPKPTVAGRAAMPGTDEGYRAALDALTTKAARLEAEGKLAEARTAWTCVSAVALSPEDIRAAGRRVEALRSRVDGGASATKAADAASTAAPPKHVDVAPAGTPPARAANPSTTAAAAWPVKPSVRSATAGQGPHSRGGQAATSKTPQAHQQAVGGGASRTLGHVSVGAPARKPAAAPRLPGYPGANRPLSAELGTPIVPPPIPPATDPVHEPGAATATSDDPIPASVRAKF